MYLDSNGDGVHTKADVVNPKGTTKIAVWLITDRNRDGTKVPCSTEATLTGFRLLLSAGNGTVRWGKFVPDPPVGTDYEARALDSRSCAAWYALKAPLRAGKHRLGAVTLVVLRGTPSVAILPAPHEYPQQGTRFFSGCSDPGRTPEHELENDWHDVDGLRYRGRANTPPVLSARATFPVRAGYVAAYHIKAHDKDGDPVTFRAVPREGGQPPSFIRVRTVNAGRGDAVGEVEVTADSCAEGEWLFNIEASDGIASDRKEVSAPVERVDRHVPANPMGPARSQPPANTSPRRINGRPDAAALAGEWEWDETQASGVYFGWERFRPRGGPIDGGTRRRLILGRDGSYEHYAISPGKVRVVEKGTYTFGEERKQRFLQFSGSSEDGGKYSVWQVSTDTLRLYPFGASDASTRSFVRVPPILRHGARLDTVRLVEPLGHAAIRRDGQLSLSASMRDVLRGYDPAFRPYTVNEWPGPGNYEYSETQIPWALIGDFDGDLISDVALYGRSRGDEVVLAVLSGHGNARVAEVARRPSKKGGAHPFLELIPRGTVYSPCWARKGTPDTDAIGIASPGVARFDYALVNGEFIVYAPVP
jgi:hypothetical protein